MTSLDDPGTVRFTLAYRDTLTSGSTGVLHLWILLYCQSYTGIHGYSGKDPGIIPVLPY